MHNYKNLIKFLLLNFLIVSTLFAKNLEKVSIQFDWKNQFQFAGYYMAKEKGFYRDAGFDVEMKEWKDGINIANELLSKRVDYAVVRPTVLKRISNGADIKLLAAIYQSSPLILLADKKSGIKTIQDCEHKKIMTTGNLNQDASILAMAKSAGINFDDMDMLKPSFDVHDLLNGTTDLMVSYIANEPFALRKLGGSPVIFNPKDYGFDFYADILATSGDEVKKHPEKVREFVKATLRGWKYAFSHIDKSVNVILKKYNTQHKSKKALLYEAKELKKLAYFHTQNIGEIKADKLEKIYYIYKVLGLAKKKIDFNDIIFKVDRDEIFLTNQERAYLKKHPIIKAHNEANWAPFNFNKNGKAKGFSIDYMNLLAKKLGIDVQYVSGYSWSEFINMLQTPKLDVIINIAKSKERAKNIAFTDSYYTTYNAIYVNKKSKKFETLKELSGKTIAITKGFFTQQFLSKYYPDIKQVLVKNQLEALKLLSLDKVDAVIGKKVVIDYLVEEYNIPNIVVTNYVNDKRVITRLRLGVSKKDILLRDILQKASKTVSHREMRELKSKWFGVKKYKNKNGLNLSTKEKEHLVRLGQIRMCVDPSWLPFEAIKNGKHVGISADFFKIFQKNLDIPIRLVKTKSWSETLKDAKNRKCDIISLAVKTPSRKKYLNFTAPYLRMPLVLVTKEKIPFITNFSSISKKFKIGIPKSYAFIEILKQKYPNLNIIGVKNTQDGLEKVASGKIFGFIGTSVGLNYRLRKSFINILKISGQFPDTYSMSVAVRNDDAILLHIFNKLANNINQDKRNKILNSWIGKIKKEKDYTLAWQIAGLSMMLILLFLYRNSTLHKYNENLEKSNQIIKEKDIALKLLNKSLEKKVLEQSRLAQMGELISMIAHQWRQPLSAISSAIISVQNKLSLGKFDFSVAEDRAKFEKFLQDKINNIEEYVEFLSTTIDEFRNFYKKDKQPVTLTTSKIVENVLKIVQTSMVNKNIFINCRLDDTNKLQIYKNELMQVILNILKNSEDNFVEKEMENKTIKINTKFEDNRHKIIISDNGGGIPKDILTKIFEPYFSTKKKKNGTGLGLYMSKTIVEEHHNGTLEVQNINNGVMFIIKI